MKIKLRIDKDEEFDYSESDYTMPIIINRTMILGVYNVHFFEMTDNMWRQLPEEYKKKIYKHNWKKFIKNMVIIKLILLHIVLALTIIINKKRI